MSGPSVLAGIGVSSKANPARASRFSKTLYEVPNLNVLASFQFWGSKKPEIGTAPRRPGRGVGKRALRFCSSLHRTKSYWNSRPQEGFTCQWIPKLIVGGNGTLIPVALARVRVPPAPEASTKATSAESNLRFTLLL